MYDYPSMQDADNFTYVRIKVVFKIYCNRGLITILCEGVTQVDMLTKWLQTHSKVHTYMHTGTVSSYNEPTVLCNFSHEASVSTSSYFCNILTQHHSGLVEYPSFMACRDSSGIVLSFDPISFHCAV